MTAATPSIAGGFVLVSVTSLMAAWRTCRSAPLGIADFRAWLACREIRARRCLAQEGRAPAYSFNELARLLGVAEKRARAAVHRLVDAGLLEWTDHAIAFPEPPADFDPGLDDSIGQGRGSLAIPRRILRLLAGGARAALIATTLGILLRCLSRRRDGFRGRGRVKSAWIARTFGVDLRRVKQARRELVELGWIEPEPSDPSVEKRYGRAFQIDLTWNQPARADGRSLPPVPPPERPAIATPIVDREPFQERNIHQEPSPGGPAGVQLGEVRGRDVTPPGPGTTAGPGTTMVEADPLPKAMPSPSPATAVRPIIMPSPPASVVPPSPTPARSSTPATTPTIPATGSPAVSPAARPALIPRSSSAVPSPVPAKGDLPAPRLADVLMEDLKDTDRMMDLLGQAVARGWVSPSEADRLRFLGAAEHALEIGQGNPAGLFIHLVRGKLWRYLTQDDEDGANRRIKAFLKGPEKSVMASMFPLGLGKPVVASSSAPARPALSEDARTVVRVRSALAAKGYRGDPFPQVKRHDPSWTRDRWDAAVAELEAA